MAMFLYRIIHNLTYRDIEEEFSISDVLRKTLCFVKKLIKRVIYDYSLGLA